MEWGNRMNDQPSPADLDYHRKRKRTRPEEFLERLESLVPWQWLESCVEPDYFPAERGRRPYRLSVMLRVHIVQLCYNLSDPATENLLYEAESVRRFARLRLSEPIPDASTILDFRHLLERRPLGQGLFGEIKGHLAKVKCADVAVKRRSRVILQVRMRGIHRRNPADHHRHLNVHPTLALV